MKLDKTTGFIEAIFLSIILILPYVLFMSWNWFSLVYVFFCFFILFGLIANVFQTDISSTSAIINMAKAGYQIRLAQDREKERLKKLGAKKCQEKI